MKVTTSYPAGVFNAPKIVVELTPDEAQLLRIISIYDETIPAAIDEQRSRYNSSVPKALADFLRALNTALSGQTVMVAPTQFAPPQPIAEQAQATALKLADVELQQLREELKATRVQLALKHQEVLHGRQSLVEAINNYRAQLQRVASIATDALAVGERVYPCACATSSGPSKRPPASASSRRWRRRKCE